MISHEKLEVYQLALKCVERSFALVETGPRGYAELSSQLRRAIVSVALNIAEGAGKSAFADKRNYYLVARGSAMESAAVCDILYNARLIEGTQHRECKNLLEQIVAMLSRMCMNLEDKIGTRGKGKGQG